MAYVTAATYREREAQWREQAAKTPPGPEQKACLALANGYANLIVLLERLHTAEAA
jgi:hypothetical protein